MDGGNNAARAGRQAKFTERGGGATALECHSCVERSDGGCSPEKMKMISCPTNTHVCTETVAAVKWSHGQFLVGEKGCGLGIPGTNDKGVDLHGIFAFSQLHNCNSSRCNSRLDIQAMALQPMGNDSARVPNGLECYSCHGNEGCSPGNATVVKCYDRYQGCFHGNVTMKVGAAALWPPQGAVPGGKPGRFRGAGCHHHENGLARHRGSRPDGGPRAWQVFDSPPTPRKAASAAAKHPPNGASGPALTAGGGPPTPYSTEPPSGTLGSAPTARGGPPPCSHSTAPSSGASGPPTPYSTAPPSGASGPALTARGGAPPFPIAQRPLVVHRGQH
uniref:UPAR/Ly6 domain-containing protein n=1 Tax=Chelydra serpentina TaxID=8475 RepID=A0A8C3SHN7_CHESE